MRHAGLQLIHIVSPTIKAVSLATTRPTAFDRLDIKPEDLICAVLPTGVTLPLLQTLTLFGVEHSWPYTLIALVNTLSNLAFDPTKLRVELQIWGTKSGRRRTVETLLAASPFNQSLDQRKRTLRGVVSPPLIHEMLSLIEERLKASSMTFSSSVLTLRASL